jgi:hypothetical protein
MRTLTLLVLAAGIAKPIFAQPQPTFYARTDVDSYIVCPATQGIIQVSDFNSDGILDLLCTTIQLGNGDGTFRPGPALNVPLGDFSDPYPTDVNGDGIPDLVYANNVNGRLGLEVMLGNGDATFQAAKFYPSSSSDDTNTDYGDSIVFYDFNGDGVKDAVLLGSGEYIFFAGRANGSFQASRPVTLGTAGSLPPAAMAAVDVNGDGLLDLVIDGTSAIEVLLGKGDGTFQRPVITLTSLNAGRGVMAVGDLNQDGSPDVALQSSYSNTVNVYFGKPDGTFRAAQILNMPGDGPVQALVIADVNGDGILDLVDDLVEVALGKGHGAFAAPVYYPVNGASLGAGGGALGIGDFRNLGRLDLVTQDNYGLSILLNGGKGKYIDGVPTMVTGGEVSCSAAGDFNGDGIPDLAISDNANILVYLGTGKAGAPFTAGATYPLINGGCPFVGDFNGDGHLDLLITAGSPTAAYAYLGKGDGTFQLGPVSPVPGFCFFGFADFNGDGILDYVSTSNLIAYGNGSFGTPSTLIPGAAFLDVATTDFNADGRPDIVATAIGNSLSILINKGDGTFQQTTTASCGGPYHIEVGDADGDGKPDIALGCFDQIGLYLNDGAGGVAAPTIYDEPPSEYAGVVTIADINGDGIPDLEGAAPGNVMVLLGQGAGKFASPIFLGTGNHTEDLFVLNTHKQKPASGIPDLVVTDQTGVIYDLVNETK